MVDPVTFAPGVFRATYTAQEVGAILGLSTNAVNAAVKANEIPCVRIGKKQVIFPRVMIAALLEGRAKAAATATPQPVEPQPGGDVVLFSEPQIQSHGGECQQ